MADDLVRAAERIVLGSMMLDPSVIDTITARLRSGDFADLRHASIFAAITANDAGGAETGPVGVAITLNVVKELQRVGGAPYLHELIAAVPTAANAGWYAGVVAEAARVREAAVDAVRLKQAADSGDVEAVERVRAGLVESWTRTQTEQAKEMRLVDGAVFLAADGDQSLPVWGSAETTMWAYGESLMPVGPPGIGKTTLAHRLVFARLGLIPDVLGMPVHDDGGNVLYLAMDRPSQIRRAMRRLMRPEWIEILRKRLVVWKGPLPVDITAPEHRGWVANFALAHDATTAVLDSVKDACSRPSDEAAANGYNLARQEALARGVQWLETHHNRKAQDGNREPNGLDDVYGHRFLTGGAGSVLSLWGRAGDVIVSLRHLKGPGEFLDPMRVLIDIYTGSIEPHEHADLYTLLRRGGATGLSVVEVARVIHQTDKPTKNEMESVRGRLKRGVDKGHYETYEHPTDRLARYRIAWRETSTEVE